MEEIVMSGRDTGDPRIIALAGIIACQMGTTTKNCGFWKELAEACNRLGDKAGAKVCAEKYASHWRFAAAELMFAVSAIDGVVSKKEFAEIEEFLRAITNQSDFKAGEIREELLKIEEPKQLLDTLERAANLIAELCDEELKERILMWVVAQAHADGEAKEDEAKLIFSLAKRWGVDLNRYK